MMWRDQIEGRANAANMLACFKIKAFQNARERWKIIYKHQQVRDCLVLNIMSAICFLTYAWIACIFFCAALARGIISLLARVQSLKRKEILRCYSSVAHQHFYEFLQGMDVTMWYVQKTSSQILNENNL